MFEEVTIGECRLILGDCREVLPLLPPCDLILTDPPYGIAVCNRSDGGVGSISSGSKLYGREEWDFEPPSAWLFGLMQEKAKNLIVWGGNYFDLPPSPCWFAWDKGQRDFTFADGELAWTNLKKAVRFLTVPRGELVAGGKEHPTQKPLRLIEWCIQHAPNPATVCDPFMGSGTTGVACARMGLQFVGIERERKYFDIACRRIEQAYAQPRLFEDAKVGAGGTAVQEEMYG
jgi:DNA modification methylase